MVLLCICNKAATLIQQVWVLQRYVFQPGYASLPADEKRALLEEGICPASGRLSECTDLKMNFAIDWKLLHPALLIAFKDLQNKQHTRVLDGGSS